MLLCLGGCATASGVSRTNPVETAGACPPHQSTLDGKPAYIVCGRAERLFSDDSESELMSEAEFEAKASLLKFLAGDRPVGQVEIEMRGFRLLKATRKGKLYTGRYGVLVEAVQIKIR